MKSFNAFQMVAMFAALPFGLAWIGEQSFKGAGIGFWVGGVVYLVSFVLMCVAVRIGMDKWEW